MKILKKFNVDQMLTITPKKYLLGVFLVCLKQQKTLEFQGLSYSVREKIRTPDLLIRSQTLYPAELRAHNI